MKLIEFWENGKELREIRSKRRRKGKIKIGIRRK